MLIDWFTIGAQIFNFLVLLVLLKVFLYDRVIKAMDRREISIKERLEEGRKEKAEALELKSEYEEQRRGLEKKREGILSKAREEARGQGEEIVAQAREKAEELGEHWKKAVRREREAFLADMARLAQEQTLNLTRRLLADLADADLEATAAGKFLDRLKALDGEDRQVLTRAMEAEEEVVVKSSRELSTDLRRRITDGLREFGKAEVAFREDEDLALGLVVVAGGHTFGFNARDALDDLRRTMDDALAQVVDEESEDANDDQGTDAHA